MVRILVAETLRPYLPPSVIRYAPMADLGFPSSSSRTARASTFRRTRRRARPAATCARPSTSPLTLLPGARALVPTGIAVAIPAGFEGQVRMRSGLALQHGLSLLNGPGTIDSDYRGEIRVILANLGAEPVTIERGERIAQLVIAPVARARLEKVDDRCPRHRATPGASARRDDD